MPIHGYPGNVITANPTEPSQTSASGVWTTEQQLINQSAGRWPPPYYLISRSLRFNSADSAYLSRTFGSNGNQKAWTLSFWVKRSKLGDFFDLFGVNAASPDQKNFRFNSDDTLTFYVQTSAATVVYLQTSQVFRDVSAWYHVVLVIDTANATSTDRIRLYANGSRITAFSSTTYPSLNLDIPSYNTAIAHYLGSFGPGTSLFNGYMTEVNFVDGQALTPSSFGQNDPNTGVWSPIKYTGTYGTNGFYLNFSDNSGTTSTTLGKDSSGNGNNWTPNNFSVTAGAGNDSLVDSPTSYGTDTGAGGEVRGNYCTLNPLLPAAAGVTLSDGNLRYTNTSGSANQWYTTIIGLSGAFYYEATCTTRGASDQYNYVGDGNALYATNGQIYIGGSLITTVATYTSGDVIGVAFGGAGGSGLRFFKNGTQVYSASASGGSTPIVNGYNSCVWDMNFGQRAFAYTAPSGFKALCTQNLPTPTIGATSTTQANDYFNPVLYTGTGSSLGVTGVGFQPDWTWIKGRSGATDHGLYDAVRGVQKQLESNTTTAETTETTGLTAFNSDGFTVGALAQLNTSSATYVAWNWKANGAGSSNTQGTITSTVSANTTAGFSIVTFTMPSSGVSTIGHGLGVAPSMVILKSRANSSGWVVYHTSTGAGGYTLLNTTAAYGADSNAFNNTAPTSSVFTVGTSFNGLSGTYLAYCFAAVAGYSAFGSYTGNGSADGPFVYTGFRPAYLLIKVSSGTTNDWIIWDSARNAYNTMYAGLYADLSIAENAGSAVDVLSNGFKIRNSGGGYNTNTATYIYAAFAESPFKYALAR